MGDRLGTLEHLLLLTVARLQSPAHGLAVRREVEARTGHAISHGAVYTTLNRLAAHGLVEAWIGDEAPVRGGRRRKLYRLTPLGARALSDQHEALARLAEGVMERVSALAADGGD